MPTASATSRLLLVLGLAIALGLAVGGDRLAAAQQGEDPRDAAVRLVADRFDVPRQRLAVVTAADTNLPMLGSVGMTVKVLDRGTGVIRTVTVDSNRQLVDAAQLVNADRALQSGTGPPLEPSLRSRLADLPGDQAVPVVFWLREPAWSRPTRVPPRRVGVAGQGQDAARSSEAALAANRADVVRPLVTGLVGRLAAAGIPALTAGGAPVVYATVPAKLVAEIGGSAEVERVYLDPVNRQDLDVARFAIGASVVQARGVTGQGVQIAQLEPLGRFATGNPYLAGVLQDATYACSTANDHTTGVAGVLRSTHPTLRGIAPDSSLRVGGSCTGVSSELNNRAAAAADWGARIFSLSYSNDTNRQPGADDRFYDDLAFNSHRFVVKSAGNLATGTGNVTSPGLGYNVLTVGNFDDHDTPAWTDDGMNSTSSFRGPTSLHGDRRKPELAAPGTNIHTLSVAAPWDTALSTGASFATPMVAGTAALLLQRNPDLGQWPEALRAILMATAINPLAGDPVLASRGGVGGVSADRADDLVQHVNGDWGAQAYACDSPSPLDVASIPATAGQLVRVVLAWNTDPNWVGWPTQPGADLDLAVVGPAGNAVARSASMDNSYEALQFVASSSGAHVVRVSRGRCDSSPNGVAWAWYNSSAPAATPSPTITPTPRPPTLTPTSTVPPTSTPVPPTCGPPRPHVSVSVSRSSGRLVVSVGTETLPGSAPNTVTALRFGATTNALIDAGGVAGRSGDFNVALAPATAQTSFVIRQAAAGQGSTVALTVVDGCGEWPTLVGGGPSTFQ